MKEALVCIGAIFLLGALVWTFAPEAPVKPVTPNSVLFLGDSITFRWQMEGHEVWHDKIAPLGAVCLGQQGGTTKSVEALLMMDHMKTISPSHVVLFIGANDLLKYDSFEFLHREDHITSFMFWDKDAMRGLLAEQKEARKIALDFVSNIEALVNQILTLWPDTEVLVMDMFPWALDDIEEATTISIPPTWHMFIDGIHLNALGYGAWADAILENI